MLLLNLSNNLVVVVVIVVAAAVVISFAFALRFSFFFKKNVNKPSSQFGLATLCKRVLKPKAWGLESTLNLSYQLFGIFLPIGI